MLAIVGIRITHLGREVIKQDMTHLELTEGMILDKRVWR